MSKRLGRLGLVMVMLGVSLCVSAVCAATQTPWPERPVRQLQPELAQVVAADARLEMLAEGFGWAEGPVAEPGSGDLLFSDVPAGKVWRWSEAGGLRLYLWPSGTSEPLTAEPPLQGANGLIFDAQRRLVLAQHGDRRLARLEGFHPDGRPRFETLIGQFEGRPLNSPNDLVQHRDGAFYFSDPPYGLAGGDKSVLKQQPVNGVYRLDADGRLRLLSARHSRPNGLAFSPDQRWLYVADSDWRQPTWWRYRVQEDGSLDEGELFFDAGAAARAGNKGLPDGLKVLPSGHVLATGPGGVWVFNAEGRHLGTIETGVAAANVALSLDLRHLYITASSYLLRIRLQDQAGR